MRMEGVKLSELLIKPGQYLRIGSDGPVIPLDDFGRAKVDESEPAAEVLAVISAKTLFPLGEAKLPEVKLGVVVVDSTNPQHRQESQRLIAEAQSLLRYPRPGPPEVFRRLDLIWEVLLYVQIVLVAFVALYLRPFSQLITLAVLCGGLFFLVVGLLNMREVWTPILPLAAATIMSWCLVGYLQQIAHPVARKRVTR